MKLRNLAGAALALTMSFQAKAASMVLAAEPLKCGGYITLEKTAETLVILRVDISANNTCKSPLVMEIKSQDIRGVINSAAGTIELNPHAISAILPVKIGDETLLLKLSEQGQREVATANTRADLGEEQRRQAEISRRNGAAGAAVVGAAVVGAGAVTAAAAANSER
ncbi:hypothetical protein [Bdellovibrio sp.]|uniref:hypothetical protein n=1 Tax=Bdellovibrio sp. TaxID=28201 RepID=UPI0039E53699